MSSGASLRWTSQPASPTWSGWKWVAMTRVTARRAERALEQGGPGGAGARIVDAAIEHRPARAVGDQVGVDVVERVGKRQAEPQHAGRDFAPGAGLGRRGVRKAERGSGRAVEHARQLEHSGQVGSGADRAVRHAGPRLGRPAGRAPHQAAGGWAGQRRGGRPRRRRTSPFCSGTRGCSPSSQARSIARVRCTRLFIVPTAQPAIAAASS